ncbi:hypothetical protein CIG75_12950 [Tumebacillus algifaecis]|uniref:HTH cro/C1-type domain-containing protein n=1 Tax=Tumebacillus algifaecis TaxID=1214604 RepID=A0A223D331_9BACL|nr:helix-turn-helix transcriptional regulator [Tumebacillus algifaecis]ASS75807.1 hypothetical protein CIG75_12950 [Tumebacillus algifaecis]
MPILDGAKVKAKRLKVGLKQIELAQGICSPSMLNQIEHDKANPSDRLASLIAERLNSTVDELTRQ